MCFFRTNKEVQNQATAWSSVHIVPGKYNVRLRSCEKVIEGPRESLCIPMNIAYDIQRLGSLKHMQVSPAVA